MKQYKDVQMHMLVQNWNRLVNQDKQLKAYRDWIEGNMFGFGERCFIWMWKELVDIMPVQFSFLEVGVFRGQIIGLMRILADKRKKLVTRYGVTPLDSSDGHWESDYAMDIERLHKEFNIPMRDLTIIQGLSTDDYAKNKAGEQLYDIVYIDGGHQYDVVKSDLAFYPNLVKPGGYLVIDDCNNRLEMPEGYFRGIESVSKAVDEVMPPVAVNDKWEHILDLVHIRVLKRVA
jgi:hypothetical protein